MPTSKNKKFLFAALVLGLLAGGILYVDRQEEIILPIDENPSWKTEMTAGVLFKYPEELTTEYISVQDWPPQVQILDEAFTCTEAGLETGRAGRTARRMVDGRTYCVTTIINGAAGSTYTQYAYAFPKDDRVIILTFTLRAVQCGNYDEPKKTACEQEREAFDIDGTVDRIAQTLMFQSP